MAPKSNINFEEIVESVKKYESEIYNSTKGKFQGPSHSCWMKISEDINHIAKPKYIYTILIENRHNILSHLSIKLNEFQREDTIVNSCSPSNTSTSSISSFTNFSDFQINLCAEEWAKMYDPEKCINTCLRKDRLGNTRNYYILQPFVWASIIDSHIYQELKIPCCITYKRAKVFPASDDCFLKIIGTCKECKSTFCGTLEKEPMIGTTVTLECVYSGDYKNCKNVIRQCGTQ